jgi:hypothetical protein
MRTARLAGSVAGMLVMAVTAWADPPVQRTITVPEVEVRSGASPQYYATSKLLRGETVEVVGEKNGYLAITPPKGSFSWVNSSDVKKQGQTVDVEKNAKVLVGSKIRTQEPDVEQVTVSRGAQLILLAMSEPMTSSSGTWFAVLPPPAEVRYIQADAVKPAAAAAPAATTSSSFTPPSATPAVNQTPPPAAGVDPRWTKATQADQAGNAPEAIRLYTELAKELDASNPTLAVQYYRRAQWLREGGGTSTGRSMSQYAYSREATPPAGQAPVTLQASAPSPNPNPPATIMRSGPGRLYRPAIPPVDGKPIFGLDQGRDRYPLYVTPQPGLSLEPFVNRNVELYGTVVYRPELRTNYMTVAEVIQLP